MIYQSKAFRLLVTVATLSCCFDHANAIHGEGVTKDYAFSAVDFTDCECAGVLITKQHVLTIEHCFEAQNNCQAKIVTYNEQGEERVHFNWVHSDNVIKSDEEMFPESDDIMIAVLDDPVPDDFIRPFAFEDNIDATPFTRLTHDSFTAAQGELFTAVGFQENLGSIGAGIDGRRKRVEARVTLSWLDTFQTQPDINVPGDSGSPAFYLRCFEESDRQVCRYVIMGIAQRASYYGEGGRSIYVNVVPYAQWIYSQIGEEHFVEDTDGDGIADQRDNCWLVQNDMQRDSDGDGVGDECDNCDVIANVDQLDQDGDSIGDECEIPDEDEDGIADEVDNCRFVANLYQTNCDANDDSAEGIIAEMQGDACDPDLCVGLRDTEITESPWARRPTYNGGYVVQRGNAVLLRLRNVGGQATDEIPPRYADSEALASIRIAYCRSDVDDCPEDGTLSDVWEDATWEGVVGQEGYEPPQIESGRGVIPNVLFEQFPQSIMSIYWIWTRDIQSPQASAKLWLRPVSEDLQWPSTKGNTYTDVLHLSTEEMHIPRIPDPSDMLDVPPTLPSVILGRWGEWGDPYPWGHPYYGGWANPYGGWGTPYGSWANPYGGWGTPYGSWANPYGGWGNPYR